MLLIIGSGGDSIFSGSFGKLLVDSNSSFVNSLFEVNVSSELSHIMLMIDPPILDTRLDSANGLLLSALYPMRKSEESKLISSTSS